MNQNENSSVVVGTYHVFGSGGACTWFSQAQDNLERLVAFLDRAETDRVDGGNNGFIGDYVVPAALCAEFGVEAKTAYYPPTQSDYHPGDGWVTAREARAGLAAGKTSVRELGWPEGLPANAPEWAKTRGNLYHTCGQDFGAVVTVEVAGDFTVVREVTHGYATCAGAFARETKIFATKDGRGDHTAEYRRRRFSARKASEIRRFEAAGLTTAEAHRLFTAGRERWAREFESTIIESRAALRAAKPAHLAALARADSRREQERSAWTAGLSNMILGRSCPRTSALAERALYIFHDLAVEDVPAERRVVWSFPMVGKGWAFVPASR